MVSFPRLKPLDEALLAEAFENFKLVATVEEHSVLGGLGGSVAEWLSAFAPAQAGSSVSAPRTNFYTTPANRKTPANISA